MPLLNLAAVGPSPDRVVDPLWISRQTLDASSETSRPGCGWLPADWMPEAPLRRALRDMARAPADILAFYGPSTGHAGLRGLIARRLMARDIEAGPGQVVLTESGSQAIDLVCRLLLEPGDCVLVDDPCYFNFQALLKAHRVRLVSTPFTPQGPDPAAFAEAVETHRPRLYLTNGGIHNPTGARLSPVNAHKILKIASQNGLIIIEDEAFADFETEPAPRLAAFDGLERVIQVGTFSKTISASIRAGYIVCRQDWVDALLDLKVASSFGSSQFSAEVNHIVLKDPAYRKYLEALRNRLGKGLNAAAAKFSFMGLKPWVQAQAGLYLWCELPQGVSASTLARAGLDNGMVLAPGNAFSLTQSCDHFMRFNISHCQEPDFYARFRALL